MPRSHEQMKAIIARGATVGTESGQVYSTPDELPSPAKLALSSGDAKDRAKAKADAKARAEQAKAELDALEAAEKAEATTLGGEPATADAVVADDKGKEDDKARPKAAPPAEPKAEPRKDEPRAAEKKDK